MNKISDYRKHVVMYSGGLASWGTALKLAQMLSDSADITLLFADTKIEHPDLYRFLREGANALRPAQLVEVADGRTPWDVFEDKRFINHRVAHCSAELKQKVCRKWVESNCDVSSTALHVGIDWTEDDRVAGIVNGWAPYKVFFPLMEGEWWERPRILAELQQRSIEIPELYKKGFLHNNCGGFCVRAGKKQFSQLLEHYPETFDYHAQREQNFKDKIGNQSVGILRETRGGVQRIVSLSDFRERGRQLSLIDESATCGCFS